jgi:hypothetical protein
MVDDPEAPDVPDPPDCEGLAKGEVPNGDPVRGCVDAGVEAAGRAGLGVGAAGRAGLGVGAAGRAGLGVNDGLISGIGEPCSAALPASVAPSLVASSFAVVPLAPARSVACERELPDPVRDDDIGPLSMTTPSPSTSGSDSRRSGAIMNGDCVFDPASSTPSSSVPNWCPFVPF